MSSSRLLLKCAGRSSAGIAAGAPCTCVALLLALMLGGCASVAPLPQSGLVSVFASRSPVRPVAPLDVEGDGLEAQRPPPMRMYAKPDDPSQPFSPNYGSVPLNVPEDAAADEPAPLPTKEAAIRGEHPI